MSRLLSPTISSQRLEELLQAMRTVRTGVIGDACIDVYWEADMTLSRLARENPHYFLPVVNERLSPGGGSNVAACAAALSDTSVLLLGALGDDWRGRELLRLLPDYGIVTDMLVVSPEWQTTAYCKPLRRGLSNVVYEDPHLYFENRHALPAVLEGRILEALEVMLTQVDVLLVADYLQFGVMTEAVRARINQAGTEGHHVLVDSRDRIHQYRRVILKPNDMEALWAISPGAVPDEATLPRLKTIALELARCQHSLVCITLGSQGCLWCEDEQVLLIPTAPAPPPVDIVGAGDSFAATFAMARAAGANGPEAAMLANLAAGVVVRKLGMTGTATADEIRQRMQEDLDA